MYAASPMPPDDIDTDDPYLDRPGGAVPDGMEESWDLAMLRELAEMSMALARAVTECALMRLAAPETDAAAEAQAALPPGFRGDPVAAQGRAARSVRLTLGLYAKIKRERAAAVAVARAKAGTDKDSVIAQIEAGADKVRAMLAGIAAEPMDRAREALDGLIDDQPCDAAEKERLWEAVDERLDVETDDRVGVSTSAMIARVCRDLGLTPDWDRWKDEPWAVEEAQASSPYTWTERFEAAAERPAADGDDPWPYPDTVVRRAGGGP
jgi:hypothetical protein